MHNRHNLHKICRFWCLQAVTVSTFRLGRQHVVLEGQLVHAGLLGFVQSEPAPVGAQAAAVKAQFLQYVSDLFIAQLGSFTLFEPNTVSGEGDITDIHQRFIAMAVRQDRLQDGRLDATGAIGTDLFILRLQKLQHAVMKFIVFKNYSLQAVRYHVELKQEFIRRGQRGLRALTNAHAVQVEAAVGKQLVLQMPRRFR